MSGREWTLTVHAPAPWITANWITKANRFARSAAVKKWREAAYAAAVAAKLPTGLTVVTIDAQCWFPAVGDLPVDDRENLRPTVKAATDGLGRETRRTVKGRLHIAKGYGLIPDDDDKHLARSQHLTIVRDATVPHGSYGRLELIIRELDRLRLVPEIGGAR